MAQTKQQISELLRSIDTEPRHRFGQNFMIDQNLVRLIVAEASIRPDDVILEVGPGTGTLTEELLASPAQKVIAVEIDRDLAGLLRKQYSENPKFELLEGDALEGKHNLNPAILEKLAAFGKKSWKLVANLPYNIASPLVIDLLCAGMESLVFTVQKEVAERLRARHAEGAYGPLSVMAQLLSKVQVLRTLPPGAFWPAPSIDSSLVRLSREDQLGNSAREFSTFLHQLFSMRRKTCRTALKMMDLPGEAIVQSLAIDPMIRCEDLSPAQLLAVFRQARGTP